MCDPSSDVHCVPHAQEGRGFVRPRRAQEESRRSLLRQGTQQPRVLRVRRLRTKPATCLLADVQLSTERNAQLLLRFVRSLYF